MSSQCAPSWTPAQTSRIDQRNAPAVEYRMNVPIGIRATPAGNEMNVRTIGMSRLKNAVAGPYFCEEPVGELELVRPDEQVLPQRSRNGRPPHAPMA